MNQSSSLDFKLVQRVCLLQQALDQAMESIEEMRGQIQDKQWMEAQLASTEKYANVQQQAIAQLKRNLAQFTEVQRHLLGVMSHRLGAVVNQQQGEFSRLQLQVQKGEAEVQTYLQYLGIQCSTDHSTARGTDQDHLALKAEVMVARSMAVNLSSHLSRTRQHLGNLTSALDHHRLSLDRVIQTIQAMTNELDSLEPPREALFTSTDENWLLDLATGTPSENGTALQNSLHRQAQYIHELEAKLMEQFSQQTQLRQRCQALAAERDYYKHHLAQMASHLDRDTEQKDAISPSTDRDGLVDVPESGSSKLSGSSLYPAVPRSRLQPPSPIQPLRFQDELGERSQDN